MKYHRFKSIHCLHKQRLGLVSKLKVVNFNWIRFLLARPWRQRICRNCRSRRGSLDTRQHQSPPTSHWCTHFLTLLLKKKKIVIWHHTFWYDECSWSTFVWKLHHECRMQSIDAYINLTDNKKVKFVFLKFFPVYKMDYKWFHRMNGRYLLDYERNRNSLCSVKVKKCWAFE